MKVVIATEFLHERNWVVSHLEEVLRLYPEAMLMSLTFQKGEFGSPIESCTVMSSSAEAETLKKYPWLMTPLVQKLRVPEETELLLTFSYGHIHYLKTPENCKHIAYFVEGKKKKSFFQKLISLSQKASLSQAFAPYKKLQSDWGAFEPDILSPFFKIGEHEFDGLRDIKREINYIFHVGDKTSFDFYQVKRNWKLEKFLFLGKEKLLDKLLENSSLRTEHCYEEGCSGTHQKLFENSKVFIDISGESFNPLVMQALSAGMRVYAPSFYQEMITDEFGFFFEKEPEKKVLLSEALLSDFDRQKGRRQALRYNGRVFKRKIQRAVAKLLPN